MHKNTSSLIGDLSSQGVKTDYRGWLDMGSVQWLETTKQEKGIAYQAAKLVGYQDEGLIQIILKEFSPRIDQFSAEITIETLKDYAQEFPVEVEQVYEVKEDNPIFQLRK